MRTITHSPEEHFRRTARLAKALKPKDIYNWLVKNGYFPEPYVLPPCFFVTAHAPYKKIYFNFKGGGQPPETECLQFHYPKTNFTDRTFGIISPEIHSQIATTIASNWKLVTRVLFHPKNKVCSYTFPIPVDHSRPGAIGLKRSGRMIYEWIGMAERDVASIAYKYKFLITTDIKNFYSSIYTHSIPWAIHGKRQIRSKKNRRKLTFFGNKLDRLFQAANDGRTNGVPIGPVVSDIISELVLSSVDRSLSKALPDQVSVVRFRDDYRILAVSDEAGKTVVKTLQSALKEFHLELNDDKTKFHKLPAGLFREYKSRYHALNPQPKKSVGLRRFRELFLSVVKLDQDLPGTGLFDVFLGHLVENRSKQLRIKLQKRSTPLIISLLLMLPESNPRAFPRVLALLEIILRHPVGELYAAEIESHLILRLKEMAKKEHEYPHMIAWIVYFLQANGMNTQLRTYRFKDPIIHAIHTGRFTEFKNHREFKLFQSIGRAAKRVSMWDHLDAFRPQ